MELAMAESKKSTLAKPYKLTPEVADAVVEMARNGYSLTMVADLLEIHRTTIYQWIRKGEAEPDSEYGDVARRIRKARAERARALVRVVEDAAADDPRWATWLLEKHHPTEYGRGAHLEVNVTAPVDSVQVIDVSGKSLSELEAELEENDG